MLVVLTHTHIASGHTCEYTAAVQASTQSVLLALNVILCKMAVAILKQWQPAPELSELTATYPALVTALRWRERRASLPTHRCDRGRFLRVGVRTVSLRIFSISRDAGKTAVNQLMTAKSRGTAPLG